MIHVFRKMLFPRSVSIFHPDGRTAGGVMQNFLTFPSVCTTDDVQHSLTLSATT